MVSSSRRSRAVPALAAGALAAAVAFTLVRPTAPEAGAGDAPPLAAEDGLELRGALDRDGARWTVRVSAVNRARAARRCRVTAALTEVRDSPMSRTIRLPRRLWTTDLVVAVAAGGRAEQRVAVPASVAAQLHPDAAPAAAGDAGARGPVAQGADDGPAPLRESIRNGVELDLACSPDGALG